MREATALEAAIGLLQLPSRARTLREGTLPSGLEQVLRIVAGEEQVVSEAVRTAGLPPSEVRAAASFYVEQILLHPEADSYRALGAGPDASTDQLRRNMALLLRWLHPDHAANSARTIYVGRVTEAWNNLKTTDRRALYDESQKKAANGKAERVTAENPRRSARPPHRFSASAGQKRRRAAKSTSIWRLLGRLLGDKRP